MPVLRPNFTDINEVDPTRAETINEILRDGGIPPASLNPRNNETDKFKKILNQNGASVENASKTIADVMRHGKYENTKLKAAEIILDLHGVRDKDGKVTKQPIFQFFIKDSAVNINQIFAPVRPNLAELSELSEMSEMSELEDENVIDI